MTVQEMVRGLVRAAEFREQEEDGKIWDDECRRALEAARARGWGRNLFGALVDDLSDDLMHRLAQEAIEADERATRPLSDDVEHSGCPHDCPRCGALVGAYLEITPPRAGESRESKLAVGVLRLTAERDALLVKLATMTAARDELADWATRYDARHRQQGGYASELLPMFTRIGDRTRDARIAELLAVGKESP